MEAPQVKMVSVWITAYNHEKYIVQALDSILMQRTTFDYEIILGEDCSSDRTREIVQSYGKKYPDKIKLYLPEKNLGMKTMFAHTYKMCTGKYHAWMDGDDYWTDPFKLQKQVDIMEQDDELVMTFHGCEVMVQGEGRFLRAAHPQIAKNQGGILTLEDFLANHITIQTPSVIVRNILPKELPPWFYSLPYLDRGIYYLLLQHGKAKFLFENMAIYRNHQGGAWSGLAKIQQLSQSIRFYQILKKNVSPKVSLLIKKRLRHLAAKRLRLNLKSKRVWNAFKDATVLLTNLS